MTFKTPVQPIFKHRPSQISLLYTGLFTWDFVCDLTLSGWTYIYLGTCFLFKQKQLLAFCLNKNNLCLWLVFEDEEEQEEQSEEDEDDFVNFDGFVVIDEAEDSSSDRDTPTPPIVQEKHESPDKGKTPESRVFTSAECETKCSYTAIWPGKQGNLK